MFILGFGGIGNYNDHLYIKGLVLVFLMLAANFLNNIVGCGVQRLLTHNMYVKQFVIFLSIYFALNFANDSDNVDPVVHIKQSLVIWVLLLVTGKVDTWVACVVYMLLMLYFFLYNYKRYWMKKGGNNERVEIVVKMFSWIEVVALCLTIGGFTVYLMRQMREHKRDFSVLKFVFGVEVCGR
jgi:hypothetical protein